MIIELYKDRTNPPKEPLEDALDKIAKLCGCAQWEYPAQVVRDVDMLVDTLRTAREILRSDELAYLHQLAYENDYEFSEELIALIEKFNKGMRLILGTA